MSLKKIIKRAKRRVGDTVDDAGSLVNRARSYLEANAPAVTEAGSAAQRLGERLILPPSVYRDRHPGESWDAPIKDVRSIGVNLAGEPAAAGINLLTGGDATAPWSDRNLDILGRRGIAGAGARFALETATDPLTYVSTGKAPAAAQLGLGALGIGDFGGRGVAGKATRNLLAGAGMGAGAAAAQEVSDNPLVGLAGGIAGMGAGFAVAGRTPGLRNLTRTEASVPRITKLTDVLTPDAPDIRDVFKTPEQLRIERAARRENPLVKEPVTPEVIAAANRRIAEQPPGPLASLNMGVPLAGREAAGALLGGGIGYATADDENRLEMAAAGAATGVLGANATRHRTLIRKLGKATNRNPIQALTNPSALADQDVRRVVESGEATKQAWKGRATQVIGPEFERLYPVLESGVTIKPDALARLQIAVAEAASERPFVAETQVPVTRTVRAKDGTTRTITVKNADGTPRMKAVPAQAARAARPELSERLGALVGDWRDIMQHPDDYDFRTPEARTAYQRMRGVFADELARERRAGVWDRHMAEMNARATAAEKARLRLVGDPLGTGDIGQIARVRERAAAEAERVGNTVRKQGEAFRRTAEQARVRAEAVRTRGGRLGAMTPGIARMDDLHKTALVRAEQAVAATDDWYTGKVETLANRIDALRTKVDTGRSAGVESGVLATERARRQIDDVMDRFELSAIGAVTPRGTGARYDALVARMRTSLEQVVEREGAQAVDPILREFDALAKQADRLYTHAAAVALADTPAAAAQRLARVEQVLDAAGVKARQAVQQVRERGQRIVASDADALEAQARLAEFRAGLADRAADRAAAPILRRGEREAAKLTRQAERLDARATRFAERVREPQQNYVPQYYPEGDVAVSRRTAVIGGQKGFQQERVYPSYREAVLDGAEMLPKDALPIIERRLSSGASAIAEQGIVKELGRQLARGSDTIVPDFMLGAVDATQYRALDDVRLVLSDSKETQRQLARQLLETANLPPGLDRGQLQSLIGRINSGDVRFYLKKETADYLDNVFGGRSGLTNNAAAKTLDQATSGLRMVSLGTDLAAVLLRGVGGVLQIATSTLTPVRGSLNPTKGSYKAVGAFGAAVRDSIVPGQRGKVLTNERYWRWADNQLEGLLPNDLSVIDRPDERLLAERFWEDVTGRLGEKAGGKVGRVIGEGPVSLEKWQWGVFMPNFKYHSAEALYDIMRPMKRYAHMNEDELMRYVAKRVNTVTSGFSRLRAGVSQDMEWLGRQTLLSPNWTRGQIANLTDVTKPGVEGDLARRFWVGMGTIGLGGAVGLSLLLTNDYSLDHIERLLDPEHPDSITNPKGRNFMRVEMPDGGFVNLFGSLTTLSRSILRPVAYGVGETNENLASGDALWEAIGGGIAAAFDWENTESIRDWVLDRKAVHLGTLEDVVNNEDKRGWAITNREGSWERLWDKVRYAGLTAPPAVFDVALNSRETATPQVQMPNRTSIKDAAAGFFGADYTPPPDDPKAIKDKVSAFLAEQGINGGADPVGTYRREAGKRFSGERRQAFETANPEIAAHIAGKTQEQAERRPRAVGREAANLYREKTGAARQQRDAAIKAAGLAHQQTADGDTYRKAVGEAWSAYIAQTEFLAKDILGDSTLEAANERLNRVYGNEEPAYAEDRMFEEYESIRAADETPEARDAMLEARRAYLAPGGEADKRYGAGSSARLRERLRNRYAAIGGETYARYFDAQQVMGDYAAIPSYRLMSTAEARRAQAIVSRAQDARRLGDRRPVLALIFADPAAADEDRMNAVLIARRGSRLRNPEKKAFYTANARPIGEFYSDVGYSLLDQIAGAT